METQTTLQTSAFMKTHSPHIRNLLLSHSSLIILGPRGCGKTTFIQSLLKECSFPYIKINSILGQKKHNFIKIMWTQIKKLFGYDNPTPCISFESLIRSLITLKNEVPKENYDNVVKHGILYIFADNIQQLHVNEKFISTMFALKDNVEIKIAFILCGINTNAKTIIYEKPICHTICIIMPKPDRQFTQNVVKGQIKKQLFSELKRLAEKCTQVEINNVDIKEVRKQLEQREKILNSFTKHVIEGIMLIQTDLQQIKRLTVCLVHRLIQYYDSLLEKLDNIYSKTRSRSQDQKYKLQSVLHDNFFKQYFNKICEYGSQKAWTVSKRIQMEENIQDQYFEKKLFYPELIRTSLFLAQVCPEADDYRRFKDYKRKTKKMTELKSQKVKVKKHNPFRIISIAESLESQIKQNSKQRALDTHSMDYYTCFQYLQEQGDLRFVGKSGAFGVGKLQSKTNEQEALDFMKEIGLKIQQFKV